MQAQPFSPLYSPGCAPCEALRPTLLFLPALQSTLGKFHYLRARIVVAQTFIPASHPLVHCQDCRRGAALLAAEPSWWGSLGGAPSGGTHLMNAQPPSSATWISSLVTLLVKVQPFNPTAAPPSQPALPGTCSVCRGECDYSTISFPSLPLLLGSLFAGPVPLIH